ncbi:hypothetical protein [Spiroplasma platyhelix]|uniref:Uncharacterized protein n=1 Tax=Spiroplasma platyhelix PALS-1 TaxID=1276218 RepID=A0A846TW60_9MOLU|nr:hypothetical protein [Spiroplasma platyhelix]MBE4703848.1 hypothetical protein [Spiroplasma platyhelix PALS-1]NKE38221.1 hypothetical protein [Spiroplasma platyhelix PALS-1]UJB29106.1 hypothetical protein SPLAT_v1c03420 [Spiroplasma platyhelix PALS-1]
MGYCIRCKGTVLATERWIKLVAGFYHLKCYDKLVARNKKFIIIFSCSFGLFFITLVTVVLVLAL